MKSAQYFVYFLHFSFLSTGNSLYTLEKISYLYFFPINKQICEIFLKFQKVFFNYNFFVEI
jgi:hypothetical protein